MTCWIRLLRQVKHLEMIGYVFVAIKDSDSPPVHPHRCPETFWLLRPQLSSK